jgi:hypothetical protein
LNSSYFTFAHQTIRTYRCKPLTLSPFSMASSSTSPQGNEPDMSLLGTLYETIEQHPPAVEARKVLVQQYLEVGWLEAARDAALELERLAPQDTNVQALVASCEAGSAPEAQPPTPTASPDVNLNEAKLDLLQSYTTLLKRAKMLRQEATLLRDLQRKKGVAVTFDKFIPDLTAVADGRISSVLRVRPPGAARAVARTMESDPDHALDVAVTDLTDTARWLRSSACQAQSPMAQDNDSVRESLAKRVRALTASLPENLQHYASSALMHVEHEVLQRTYVCDETMLGDPISEVPRAHFWVSEDGYAWDMEELAQALASNGGVMRNPLSKKMFTSSDIRAIVQHPLGSRLAALRVEQSKLSKGVRTDTISRLEKLSAVFLADMSEDQLTSRHALEEFSAYLATLPQSEQNALDKLRVPAHDSHTGQPFDTSIGEAVRDAQGNKVCVHKTGDLLAQAARHLRQRK